MEKPATLLKTDCGTGVSLRILQVFLEQLFHRIPCEHVEQVFPYEFYNFF